MTTPADAYTRLVEAGRLQADTAQAVAVAELTRLHDELVARESAH